MSKRLDLKILEQTNFFLIEKLSIKDREQIEEVLYILERLIIYSNDVKEIQMIKILVKIKKIYKRKLTIFEDIQSRIQS